MHALEITEFITNPIISIEISNFHEISEWKSNTSIETTIWLNIAQLNFIFETVSKSIQISIFEMKDNSNIMFLKFAIFY